LISRFTQNGIQYLDEMKSLPNVTLISYDNTDDPSRTMKALKHCASLILFADVIMCGAGEATGYKGAMEWEVFGLNRYVETEFSLCVHHDGFIINPDKWNDDWLQYDFIGAPWPGMPDRRHPGKSDYPGRVGNTGFCLRSKEFMQHTAALKDLFLSSYGVDQYGQTLGGDTFISQHQRPFLESVGMKYAPVEVAADFSWESNIEEFPNGRPDAFGFHSFNLENKKAFRL